MSYILDALQKSEQERQRDSIPDLQTVHSPGPPKKRKRLLWPWLLVAALLINAVLLTLFFPARRYDNSLTEVPRTEHDKLAASRPPVADTTTTEETAGRDLLPHNNTGDDGAVAESIPAVRQTEIPAEMDTSSADTLVGQRPAAQVPSSLGRVATGAVSLANHPDRVNHPDDRQEQKIPPAQEDKITSSPAQEPSAYVTESEAAHPAAEIPLFASLPQSLRQSIPELTISFHVYTQKPATRLVSINGRIIREGQEVAPGLTLEEITAAGVILNYKGDRFRMEVF